MAGRLEQAVEFLLSAYERRRGQAVGEHGLPRHCLGGGAS